MTDTIDIAGVVERLREIDKLYGPAAERNVAHEYHRVAQIRFGSKVFAEWPTLRAAIENLSGVVRDRDARIEQLLDDNGYAANELGNALARAAAAEAKLSSLTPSKRDGG